MFVISGEGPYKQKLYEDASQKKITNLLFFNLLPIEEFNIMLNATFIHLVIQKESGKDLFLPSKLTNILGIGGCVIVTAVSGTSLYEIINDNNCGYLIPSSDIRALCAAINEIDQNKERRKLYSENALLYAHTFLYQKSLIKNYMNKTGMIY